LVATAPLWLFPLAWWLTFSPNEVVSSVGHWLAQLEVVAALGLLATVVYLLCVPVLLCFRRYRPGAIRNGAPAVVFVVCFFVGLGWGRSVRHRGLEQLPGRAQPLVDAITAYEAQHGRPPGSLDELVPDYLDHVPGTGVGVHPRFYYFRVDPGTYRGNMWVLHGPCPSVVFGFDTFTYYPRQNYDQFGLSPIGNWGYFQD
jgi:hypothetical protein